MSQGTALPFARASNFTEWNWWMSGRLTLTSGTAVTTSDVTAATTLYYTPYIGNRVSLWDTTLSRWTSWDLSEISIAIPSTTATNYDVWIYNNSGALALELLAWTNDTTRATALTTQNGIYMKNGDLTRRYLGTIRTTGTTGQCEDSVTNRYVWNYYNRVVRNLFINSISSHSYTTGAWRYWNNDSTLHTDFVLGVAEDIVNATIFGDVDSDDTNTAWVGINIDTSSSSLYSAITNTNAQNIRGSATESIQASAGHHYLAAIQFGATGANYTTVQVSAVIKG